MRALLLSMSLVTALSGCGAMDTLTDGLKHSREVEDDLETSVGSRPAVGFNWSNGSLTSVSITFEGIPRGVTTERISELSKDSVAKRFKQDPRQVILSFSLKSE